MLFCDNNMQWILASYQQLLSNQANVHSIKYKAMYQLLLNTRVTSSDIMQSKMHCTTSNFDCIIVQYIYYQ